MTTNPPTSPRDRIKPGRLYGVDVARAVAIAGMVMVHFGPYPVPETLSGTLYGLSEGRASVLFAVLAGVGVSLLGRPRGREASESVSGARTRVRLVLRGLLLLPLGLWLQRLDHGALVILQYYGVYFLLAALVLTLPDRRLLAGAAGSLLAGPLVYLLAGDAAPVSYAVVPASLGDPLPKLAHNLLLSGAYPLVTWAAPLLFGMWLGRRDLRSAAVRSGLLVGGISTIAAAALVSSLGLSAAGDTVAAPLLAAEPHSQTIPWIAGSLGSACAVIGLALLLTGVARGASLSWPLAATGQMALTVYVGHLLLLHYAGGLLDREAVFPALLAVLSFMALAVALCTLWRSTLGRGPLERLLSLPATAAEAALDLLDRARGRASSSKGR